MKRTKKDRLIDPTVDPQPEDQACPQAAHEAAADGPDHSEAGSAPDAIESGDEPMKETETPELDSNNPTLEWIPALTQAELDAIESGDLIPKFTMWLHDGKRFVIDDPHVHRHLLALGRPITPDMIHEVDEHLMTWADVADWCIRNTMNRRHLNNFQLACMAVKLWPVIAERAKARQGMRTDLPANLPEGSDGWGDSRDQLAKRFRISARTLDAARDIIKALESGELGAKKRRELENGEASIWGVKNQLDAQRPDLAQSGKKSAKKNGAELAPAAKLGKSVSDKINYAKLADNRKLLQEVTQRLADELIKQFADYVNPQEIDLTITVSWIDAPGLRFAGRDPNEPPTSGPARLSDDVEPDQDDGTDEIETDENHPADEN